MTTKSTKSTKLVTDNGTTAVEAIEPAIFKALVKVELDSQVATARAYPRDLVAVHQQALALVTLDEETAAEMFYVLPRGSNADGSEKFIEGPSIRFAEAMVYAFGSIRVDGDVIDIGKTHLTAEGLAWDMEKNTAFRVHTKRRITNKQGQRFNDDMIAVTANAAVSIAMRNAILKVIPMALVRKLYNAARDKSVGEAGEFSQRVTNALAWFAKMKVDEAAFLALVDCPSVGALDREHLARARGIQQALMQGETTVKELLSPSTGSESASSTAELNAATTPAEPNATTTPAATTHFLSLLAMVRDAKTITALDAADKACSVLRGVEAEQASAYYFMRENLLKGRNPGEGITEEMEGRAQEALTLLGTQPASTVKGA